MSFYYWDTLAWGVSEKLSQHTRRIWMCVHCCGITAFSELTSRRFFLKLPDPWLTAVTVGPSDQQGRQQLTLQLPGEPEQQLPWQASSEISFFGPSNNSVTT